MCLNLELFVQEELNPPTSVKFIQKNWCTPTQSGGANWALSAGVNNIWPLKNTTICNSSGAKWAHEAGFTPMSAALAPI